MMEILGIHTVTLTIDPVSAILAAIFMGAFGFLYKRDLAHQRVDDERHAQNIRLLAVIATKLGIELDHELRP